LIPARVEGRPERLEPIGRRSLLFALPAGQGVRAADGLAVLG
jgi:hypothetical protein